MGASVLEAFCHRQKILYIYGAGAIGRITLAYLEEQGITVDGFIETKASSACAMGKPIMNAEAANKEGGFIIGVSPVYEEEIIHTLEAVGISRYFRLTSNLISEMQTLTQYKNTRLTTNHYVNVLLYHRIGQQRMNPWNMVVTPQHFEEHIRYVKNNYPVLRFEDDWSNVHEPSVVVTFDDGYADNYEFAMPIMEKYQIPITFFVSTGNLGTEKKFWWDRLARIMRSSALSSKIIYTDNKDADGKDSDKEQQLQDDIHRLHSKVKGMLPLERESFLDRLEEETKATQVIGEDCRVMTSEELKRLSSSKWATIGAHTVTHSMLSVEPFEMQQQEIADAKTVLEHIIAKPVDVFSYPFGGRKDISSNTVKIVRMCGYKKAAANWGGTAGTTTDPFLIPRNSQRDYDGKEFARRLRGIWYMFGDD